MEYKDKTGLEHYFSLSRFHPFKNVTHQELLNSPSGSEKWFVKKTKETLVCSRCIGRTCHVSFHHSQPFILCPEGEPEIIEVDDNNRYSYEFDRTRLYDFLKEPLSLAYHEPKEYGKLALLGENSYKNIDWLVGFVPTYSITNSIYDCLAGLKENQKNVLLILTDDLSSMDSSTLGLLSTHGIFVASWDSPLENALSELYDDQKANLFVRETFRKMKQETETELEISALERTATHADGDGFEEEVYKVIRRFFQTVVPFGGQYKGFAVPDGLITQGKHTPFPVLFYDCKSFKSEEYKHKPQIPMQLSYYETFLQDFYRDNQVENSGFIIFSSSFPEEVKQQITGSAQWKTVFQSSKLFFISVSVLERIKRILDLFETNGNFLSEDFFHLCFKQKTSLIRQPKARTYYEKIFEHNVHFNYYFLSEDQVEVALVVSFLNYVSSNNQMEGLSRSLKEVLENALHENLKRKVEKPTMFYLYEVFMGNLEQLRAELHPMSTFLILMKQEEELYKILGESKFNQLKDDVINQLESLEVQIK